MWKNPKVYGSKAHRIGRMRTAYRSAKGKAARVQAYAGRKYRRK